MSMPRGVSVHLGGAGAHLTLPACWSGEPGGGLLLVAAGSLPLLGGSRGGSLALLQTEASLRSASSHFRGRFARSSVPH